ncbi:hypothetical protein YC2023_008604 [Brassica napus]
MTTCSVVQNTVLTDRSRNHPGVRSLIGIRIMSMKTRPRRSQPPLRGGFWTLFWSLLHLSLLLERETLQHMLSSRHL